MLSVYEWIGVGTLVVGATWTIRAKLGDVEKAMAEHVGEDRATHAAQDARIIRLEGRRRGR